MAKHLVNVRVPLVTCLAASLIAACALSVPAQQPASAATTHRLQPSSPLPQTAAGRDALLKRFSSGERSAISLATGNFFEDGRNGLVTGYSLGEGGVIAVQQGAMLPRNEDAENVAPFVARTSFVDVGLRPDFLVSADFAGDGHQDVVAAARGGHALSVLLGDGQGGFQPAKSIPVAGSVKSLAAWRGTGGKQWIAAGVCGDTCTVDLYQADGSRFARIPVTGTPRSLSQPA